MTDIVATKELAEQAEIDMIFVRQVISETYKYAYLSGQKLNKCRKLFEVNPHVAEQVYGYDNFGQTCAAPLGFNVGGSIGSRWADVAEVIDQHIRFNHMTAEQFLALKSWNKIYMIKDVIKGKDSVFTVKWLEKCDALGPYDVSEEVKDWKRANGIPFRENKKFDKEDKWEKFKEQMGLLQFGDPTKESITFKLLNIMMENIDEE